MRTHPEGESFPQGELPCVGVWSGRSKFWPLVGVGGGEGKGKGLKVFRMTEGTLGKVPLLGKREDLQVVALVGFVKRGRKQARIRTLMKQNSIKEPVEERFPLPQSSHHLLNKLPFLDKTEEIPLELRSHGSPL